MPLRSRIAEWGKNLLILILFALMIVLLVSYITQTRLLRDRGLVEIPIDQLLTVRGDEDTELTSDGSYNMRRAMPTFIGYKMDEQSPARGMFADENTVFYLYRSVSGYLESLFSEASFSYYPADTETASALWQQSMQAKRYVYMKYPSSLPFPVLATYLGGVAVTDEDISRNTVRLNSVTSGEDGSTDLLFTYVSELFILLDVRESGEAADGRQRYTYYAVARDEKGNVTLFRFADDRATYYFDTMDVKAYDTNSEFVSYDFYGNMHGLGLMETLPLEPTAVMTDGNRRVGKIGAVRAFALPETDASFGGFLNRLGYGGNVNRYTEGDETAVYVNSYGFLRLTPSAGTVTFEATAKDSGIPLSVLQTEKSDFFADEEQGQLDVIYDCINAAETVMDAAANALGAGFEGGMGHAILRDVYHEDGNTVLTFGCVYNGVEICEEDGSPLILYRFTFWEDTLTAFTARFADVYAYGSYSVSYSITFAARHFLPETVAGERIGYRMGYCLTDAGDEQGVEGNWIGVRYVGFGTDR